MSKAAGILFVSTNGNALFLKRGPGALDFPAYWDFPGGGQEGDETAEQTAIREVREEIGFVPEGARKIHTRTRGSAPKGVAGLGASAVLPVPSGAPTAAQGTTPAALPDVDFTTFFQKVTNEFTPELNDEHDGWAWAPLASPPEPLHPGCRIALERISMDEVGVARAIAEGRLASPQRYENVWLFAIRITGTEAAFRSKIGEYVIRKPENYLNDAFLARCNGLPVIFKHPKGAILNSEEFSNRVVGTVFLPYVAGDEVWAVAKIFIDDVARMMEEGDLSTSPGVNFEDFSVNAKLTLEDGSKVLIEGKPSLFDHVAICDLGVWDKGGDPSGIRSETREDSAMTPEEEAAKKAADDAAKKKADDDAARKRDDDAAKKKADDDAKAKDDAAKADAKKKDDDAARKDAEMGEKLDKVLSHVDSMTKRMDTWETKEKEREDAARRDAEETKRKAGDPEQLAADKAKKDAEETEKKAMEDKAKKDAEEKAKADSADVRQKIADLNKTVHDATALIRPISDDDHMVLADAWSRADSVFNALGKPTPRAMPGELAGQYRRRVAKLLKEFSPAWKTVDNNSQAFADDATFAIAEGQILADAGAFARLPSTVPAGQLRMITKHEGGHEIREFVGDPGTWMNRFAGPVQLKATGAWKTPNNSNAA